MPWVTDQGPEGGSGDLWIAAEDGALNGLEDVGKDPGDHLGVEGHDEEGGQHAEGTDQPPGLPFGGQGLQGGDGVALGPAPEGDLGDHHRQTDEQGRQQIDQQEAGAAVFPGHVGKLPDITQADGRAEGGGEDAEAAGESIPFRGKGLLAHSFLDSTVNAKVWHILSHDFTGRQIFPLIGACSK